jgi:hypothetical protein
VDKDGDGMVEIVDIAHKIKFLVRMELNGKPESKITAQKV